MKNLIKNLFFAVAIVFPTSLFAQEVEVDSAGRLLLGDADASYASGSNGNNMVIGNTSDGGYHGMTIVAPTNRYGVINFSDGNSGSDVVRGRVLYSHSDNTMRISTDAAEAMVIDDQQRFGFGGMNPNSGYQYYFYSSANLFLLQRGGTSGSVMNFKHGGNNSGSITVSGNNTTYNTTSDPRMKSEFADLTNSCDVISKIKIGQYHYLNDGEKKKQCGFDAHQLAKLYPDAVTPGEGPADLPVGAIYGKKTVKRTRTVFDGNGNKSQKEFTEEVDAEVTPWMIDYGKVTPLLASGIQELISDNKAKDKKIAELEARLARIEAALQKN